MGDLISMSPSRLFLVFCWDLMKRQRKRAGFRTICVDGMITVTAGRFLGLFHLLLGALVGLWSVLYSQCNCRIQCKLLASC